MNDFTDPPGGQAGDDVMDHDVSQDAGGDLDAELEAIWARQSDEHADQEEETTDDAPADSHDDAPNDEASGDDEPDQATEEVPEPPSYIPAALKERWGDLPEDVRGVVDDIQKDYHAKFTMQGREIQALSPIRDALSEAIENVPMLADMQPGDVAREVTQLAAIGQRMKDDPVNTILTLVQQHGIAPQMVEIFTGQAPQQGAVEAQRELAELRQRVQQLSDPKALRANFEAWSREAQATQTVEQFIESAEHWNEVEAHMPAMIQVAREKLGEGVSERTLLEEAYNQAINIFLPEKATKPAPAEKAEAAPDPEKAQAALKAKSVNVSGKPTGKPRPMTLDDELKAVWRKNQEK